MPGCGRGRPRPGSGQPASAAAPRSPWPAARAPLRAVGQARLAPAAQPPEGADPWRTPSSVGAQDGRPSGRPASARQASGPAVPSVAGPRRRLHPAAQARPLPAAGPGAGRDRAGPALAAGPGRALLVPELRPAAAHRRRARPSGSAWRNFTSTFADPEFWLVAAQHGAVRGRRRAADPDHRHRGRPAAEPPGPQDVGVRLRRRAAGLGHSRRRPAPCCSTGCSTRTAAWSTGRCPRCRTGWSAAPTGPSTTGPPPGRCRPTRC